MVKKWFYRGNKQEVALEEVKKGHIPEHIAIIMDGNGRWAKKRALPRVAGHNEGMQTVKKITKTAAQLGVKVLTLYAFSTENWKRPKAEVEFLMKLPGEFMETYLPELMEANIQVRMIGNVEQLPSYTYEVLAEAVKETKQNTGLIVNFALNYGSRDEITQAIQQIASECQSGKRNAEEITEELVSTYLFTKEYPDPALVIRTSGELRISNFLLWQIAYSELYFSEVLWPDFDSNHFLEAIKQYQQRNRRYGGI